MAMKREIIISGEVAYIPLTLGFTAVIDAADVPLVDGRNWHANPGRNTVYAQWNEPIGSGKYRLVLLHRVLLGLTDPTIKGDHKDGDGLNNRRYNLRPCSNKENSRNSRPMRTNNTSGFKGVSWNARDLKWHSRIRFDSSLKHIGYFDTPEAAHAAYCIVATELYGEFARVA